MSKIKGLTFLIYLKYFFALLLAYTVGYAGVMLLGNILSLA